MNKGSNKISDYLVVAITPLCWAGDVVLAKGGAGLIPPFSLAFWRWFVAFLVLFPFALPHLKKDWSVAKQKLIMLFMLSILGISIFISLIYTAVLTTTAINVALIQTIMPAAIVLNCYLLYKEKVSVRQLACLFACFAGVCFVILQGNLANLFKMSFVLGDILMLIATMMYGLYTALLQRKAPRLHPLSLLTILAGFGAIALLPAHFLEVKASGGFDITGAVICRILYAAVFPSIVAYFCWMRGIATIGANRTGMFINLLPVYATILATLFLGEAFRWFHLVGMGAIISGMFAFNKFGLPKEAGDAHN